MPKTAEECWSLVRWANAREARPLSSSMEPHVSYRDGPYNVPSLAVSGAWQGIIDSRESSESSTARGLDHERGASSMAARTASSDSALDQAISANCFSCIVGNRLSQALNYIKVIKLTIIFFCKLPSQQ